MIAMPTQALSRHGRRKLAKQRPSNFHLMERFVVWPVVCTLAFIPVQRYTREAGARDSNDDWPHLQRRCHLHDLVRIRNSP